MKPHAPKPKAKGAVVSDGVGPLMRNEHGHVVVRHPAMPGPHMMAPSQDYHEVPFGQLAMGGGMGMSHAQMDDDGDED